MRQIWNSGVLLHGNLNDVSDTSLYLTLANCLSLQECTSLNHHLGIEASPVTPDLLEWVAKIKGIEDTFWEGNVTESCRSPCRPIQS